MKTRNGRPGLGKALSLVWMFDIVVAIAIVVAGGYQLLGGEWILGIVSLALGAVLLFGAVRRRVFAFQLLAVGGLLSAIGLAIVYFYPGPEGSRQFLDEWVSIAMFAAMFALSAGNALLARKVHLVR